MVQRTITNKFEAYCNEIVNKYQAPGFSIGLEKDGKLVYEKGFGYRDVEDKLPWTSDTVLGIGSVTKSFTSVAIMQLQEAGKLSIHDPVVKYLHDFKTNNEEYTKQMTIHHFMSHSSGLPPMPTLFGSLKKSIEKDPKFDDESKSPEEKAAEEEAMAALTPIETFAELMDSIANADYELLGPPGEEFSYSNDCYALLGAIITRASGISYEQYIKEYILDPAGMKNSVFHLEELEGHDDVSSLYAERKKGDETIVFKSNNPWDAPAMRAAGFLKSTLNDMLKFAEIYWNEGKVGDAQLLSPESVEAITTPHIECQPGTYYGYGVMITPDFFGHKLVEHGGDVKGVAAQMNILPELRLAGFANANLEGVPSTKLLNSAFANYLGESVTASNYSFTEIELSEDELKQYAGVFASGEGSSFNITVEDGSLQIDADGLSITDIKPIGNDSFLLNFREMEFVLGFIRNGDNKIIRASFSLRQFPKVK